MYLIKHTIAGITFVTESDIELTALTNRWFQPFITGDIEPDIHHQFRRVEMNDLTMPELSNKERESISRCNIPHQLGPGSFIMPPFVRDTKIRKDQLHDFKSIQNPLDIPLLRSLMVRERLEACLIYPKQVGLTLHVTSVVIYDYHLNRIDTFFLSDQQWVFENIPLDNGLRRMFTSFLPSFSATMLHSSGIIREGRAALFLAPDEGGKSTTIENQNGGTVLSDDRNIVRKKGKTFTVYSTPWGKITNGPQQARLGGLFIIEKAEDFELTPEKPRDMLVFLWNEHMPFWDMLPNHMRVKAFEILTEVCHQTPCYRMRFPKDYVDWNAIDAAMVK